MSKHLNFPVVRITITLILLTIAGINLLHQRYKEPDRVIEWDIKSYYAYLPAAIIHGDLTLEFGQQDFEKYSQLLWPLTLPSGNKILIYTMGMSFLYSPFFLAAHGFALITHYEADGYSKPYRFALTFSALFYVWLGLVFLAKILRRYFSENVIAITLFVTVAGTNLLYYSTYEAPMTHAFSFALICVFIWQTITFYESPSLRKILLTGAMAGLIALIRPSNIIILLVFFLWDIRSANAFRERFFYFMKRYYWVILMAAAFTLVWVPQFIYWYNQTGSIFFYSYGANNETFDFTNPQIINILFSYRKGWLVYTPIMLFALAGMFIMRKQMPGLILPITIFMIINIYILSSWWSWWYGGSFGQRSFIDSYGLLSLPFAAAVHWLLRAGLYKKLAGFIIMILLVMLSLFQSWQYVHHMIHYDSMNKGAYWSHFLRTRETQQYWDHIIRQMEINYSSSHDEETENTE